jgi:ABC-2 type transport system permease protein
MWRNFLIQAYLNYKALFYWQNWSGYLSSIIAYPIMTVIVYTLLGRFMIDAQAAQYFAVGAAVSSIAFVIIGGIGQTYSYDRQFYTFSFTFITRANRFLHFLSRGLFHYPNALIAFTSSILATFLMTGVDFSTVNWWSFLVSALVVSASLCGFAQFLSIFSIVTRDWVITLSISLSLLNVLTGIVIPVAFFPPFVREVVKALPVTSGLTALRHSFIGSPLSETYLLILGEAAVGIAYLLAGAIGFIVFEKVAKKTGVMETEVTA